MKIQLAATKIISMWEHGGRYDSHGNGAYGLIGWQGDELVGLLHEYQMAGGVLSRDPEEIAHDLLDAIGTHRDKELDFAAGTELMQRVQWMEAGVYMEHCVAWQNRYYHFATALGQLIICDIGVNSGINNFYVKYCGGGPQDAELYMLRKVMEYRRSALKKYQVWQKYEGIRRWWAFL